MIPLRYKSIYCGVRSLALLTVLGMGSSYAATGDGLPFHVATESKRPNIILIMTDDQGYGDLGCHGHPFLKTPNLDQLYAQSTRFTDFHASPTCSPTRAALMSGRAPFKNGVTHTILERERMSLDATTIAEVLKSAGYSTAIFGKWHLGDSDPYQPENRGFDEVFIHGGGVIGESYPGSAADVPVNKKNQYFDPVIKHNGRFIKTQGYCTDVFFRETLGWIKEHKDEDNPFFVYLAPNAPHGPYIVAEKYRKPFEGLCDSRAAAFYGMIVNIDENIGLLMQKLSEWGLADNTLLIFMTDNGSAVGWKIYNAGMRGGKTTVNEGGTHVPLFMRLPNNIQEGVDINQLTRHVDLFPTLVEVAGAKMPDGLDLDGRSLVPLLQDSEANWGDRNTFFHKARWGQEGAPGFWGTRKTRVENAKNRDFAVRSERWRLVGESLYDIQQDPGELHNVADEYPDVVAAMRAEYNAWWDEVRPLMVNENAPLDVPKPFVEQYERQVAQEGIPQWEEPQL